MFNESTAIRALAHALRRRAHEIRELADHLAREAETVAWQGLAADAMRTAVHHAAAGLRRTAGMHDDAAEALERHARRVGVVQEAIDGAVHRLRHVLGALG